MKKETLILLLLLAIPGFLAAQLKAPGVKWSDTYSFDQFNHMKIDFFAKNDELIRSFEYKTWFNTDAAKADRSYEGLEVPAGNFIVQMDAPGKGRDLETIFDMVNQVAIQVFGSDLEEPMYNAGGFKFPAGDDIKNLTLVAANETRSIAGHQCSKYTYTYKKIFGSVWITTEVILPNDLGIFRAAKMGALHNTLSVPGFVMEMTSEDARGGKTVMTTISLENKGKLDVSLPRSKMSTAINKVNYFTF